MPYRYRYRSQAALKKEKYSASSKSVQNTISRSCKNPFMEVPSQNGLTSKKKETLIIGPLVVSFIKGAVAAENINHLQKKEKAP